MALDAVVRVVVALDRFLEQHLGGRVAMPRVAMPRRSRLEGNLSIVITFTGDAGAAYDAARRVLDAGTLQDAMSDRSVGPAGGPVFAIVNAEVK
jgi:hypothetical protein